ncbi:MAG: PQQ-dependent sugar dehydrogenase [Pirellulales bacterium]|nr:PQQ-dependent sugar dehydrogenase [Pirellulales bacterium]
MIFEFSRNLRWSLLFLAVWALCAPAYAQLSATRVASGLSNPLFATHAPGQPNTLYIVQKGGAIRTLNLQNNTLNAGNFLNIPTVDNTFLSAGGEQGLLGLAFHPNFQTNGHFYVNYTYGTGSGDTRVERYTYNHATQTVNTASRQTVMQFDQPFDNHNGGWMGFGPDGFLYIASGDGGSANDPQNNGQNRNTLLGKMLRVDVNNDAFPGSATQNYAIPANNPFVGVANTRPEVWAYGLRNPWRNSFDRQTGDLWIADVGQGAFEEVNFQAANALGGANYGWRLREGLIATPATGVGGNRPTANVDPIAVYDRNTGISITGGYVYRGGDILDMGQNLDGTYFFADFAFSKIFTLRYSGSGTPTNRQERTITSTNGGSINSIASFGEDSQGRLYIVDYGGEVFRIQGPAIPEPGMWVAGLAALGLVWHWRRRQSDPAQLS